MFIENVVDFVERHPILTVLGILYLLSPIPFSISMWNEHPKKIECTVSENVCKFNTYSYKHDICWDTLLASRYSKNRYCRLPKYLTGTLDLIPLNNIQDVIYKKENGIYKLYLKDKSASDVYVTSLKSFENATYQASHMKAHIKKWQADLDYAEGDEKYEYQFID